MNVVHTSGSSQDMLSSTTIFTPLGGQGSRARQYTKGRYSKFLIPLRPNFAVLDGIILSLLQAGFRNYVFCVGTLFPGEIVERVLSHKNEFDKLGCTYRFSFERRLLGGVGAYCRAINKFKLSGTVVSVPGDMFLPWHKFPDLVRFHDQNRCSITIGLTDVITDYTTDVGKIWIERNSKQVVRCLSRTESAQPDREGALPLTSAGVYAFNAENLKTMYKEISKAYPNLKRTQVEMRDQILPWLIGPKKHAVKGYNLHSEILDVGDYDRILYAKKNWRRYFDDSLI